MEGTVKELAERFDTEISMIVGFLDGISESLKEAIPLDTLEEDTFVSVKIDVFKGMWHVFQMSPLKIAHEAMERNAEFIFDICR